MFIIQFYVYFLSVIGFQFVIRLKNKIFPTICYQNVLVVRFDEIKSLLSNILFHSRAIIFCSNLFCTFKKENCTKRIANFPLKYKLGVIKEETSSVCMTFKIKSRKANVGRKHLFLNFIHIKVIYGGNSHYS